MHWRDLDEVTTATSGSALIGEVPSSMRPRLVVDVAGDAHLRLGVEGRPALWLRVASNYNGFHMVRAPSSASMMVVPYIRSAEFSRAVAAVECGEDTTNYWARRFAEWLSVSDVSPLTPGTWRLGSPRAQPRAERETGPIEYPLALSRHAYVPWDFAPVSALTLRDTSSPDSGRVKWWRKQVRSGAVPPVLLWWVSGLASYVVPDGHDRLQAAMLEQTRIDVLELQRVEVAQFDPEHASTIERAASRLLAHTERARSPRKAPLSDAERVEIANDMLLECYTPEYESAVSRARAGGLSLAQWRAEVDAAVLRPA